MGLRYPRRHQEISLRCFHPFRRWFLETISPIPLLGLHEDGDRLLSALRWLELNCRKRPLDEQVIREYNRMIYKGGPESAGQYRKGKTSVIGSTIPRPAAEKVPALMKQLDLKLDGEQRRLDGIPQPDDTDVLTLAILVHQRIAFIHPFADANGRIARLAMNHLLRRYNFGYSIFPPVNESQDHWNALEEAHHGNLEPLVKFAKAHICQV